MSEKAYELLNLIKNKCGVSYQVIGFDALKLDGEMQKEDVNELLNYLKVRGYINISYMDKNVVCVCVSNKGLIFERQVNNVQIPQERNYPPYFLILLVSFTGSFLGAIIVQILFRFL